jgi:hypothetical protein
MNADELKRWKELLKTTDGLFKRSLRAESWIMALRERLAIFEGQQTGERAAEIRKSLRERQKAHYQTLLEQVESRDPGYAAGIDDRNIEDAL